MTSVFDFCKELLSGAHPFLVVVVLVLGICYLRSVKLNITITDRPKKGEKNA